NDNCGSPVSSDDPLLGPLQDNKGFTPTMAIPKTSPAWNTADPDTSQASDQRGQPRPAMNGFDIGAFELCLDRFLNPCMFPPESLQTKPQTKEVPPAETGTTTPAPENYREPENWVVVLEATAFSGYHFLNWSGAVASPANPSTTVVMDRPQT